MLKDLFRRKTMDQLVAEAEEPEHRLKKALGPVDVTALGIGAIIGTGIFVLTAVAAQKAGPGMMLSFCIAAETAPVGNVSRGQRGLSFQASLLVKRSKRKRFESLLEKFARDWAQDRRIECTGPWPPYSFVSRPADKLRAK